MEELQIYKKNIDLNSKTKMKIKIAIISLLALIITIFVFLLIFYWKPWKNGNQEEKAINNYQIDFDEYKNELFFKTKVNDIRRFSFIQKIVGNNTMNDIEFQTKIIRKIYYDIYIISENECDQVNKKYCNKTFFASIAKASECLSFENENCEPSTLVDFISNSKVKQENLKELEDLKDIPISLCLFHFTDTNIITSISCPESLPENVKNELLSDLFYFRPLPKKSSARKDNFNINIENNIKNIKRISKGFCDIKNNINSFCDFEINIKKDNDGNLQSFDEISLSNITSDKCNSLKKNKITKLIDETSKFDINPDKYKEILEKLLIKLNPYLKNKENFSMDNLIKEYANKKNKKIKNVSRFLTEKNINKYFIKEENLFVSDLLYGINLVLKFDSGLGNEIMKSFLNLKYDGKEKEYVNLNQSTSINRAIKSLNSIYKTGNYLAFQLYEKLQNYLDSLVNIIPKNISYLNNLIVYKNLTEIFDSISFNTHQILPMNIIAESNYLVNNLSYLINEIENEGIKNYLSNLYSNIDDYFTESYDFMKLIFDNLYKLQVLLNSPKNKFIEIEIIYLNNTPTSYVNIIQKTNDIYRNYGLIENNIIANKMELINENIENNYQQSIKSKKIN